MLTRRWLMPSVALAVWVAAALLTTGVAAQDATPAAAPVIGQATTSPVFWYPGTFWGGTTVPHASSALVTYDEGASVALQTAGLEPGHTVTLWWVVFNNPEACTHGDGGLRCGEGDLLLFGGDTAVEGTVVYGAGHVIGPDGEGHFSSYLAAGDATRVLGDGPGLVNPLGADIHFVVRTHGPVQPGILGDQIQTVGGGCNNAPEGTGAPGDYACADLQFAAHEQTLA